MGRRKLNKVTIAFVCSKRVCELLTRLDATTNRSRVINTAVNEAISRGDTIENESETTGLSPRVSASVDKGINEWLDANMLPTGDKSNFINKSIEKYLCK